MDKGIDESLVAVARELGPLIREHAPEAEAQTPIVQAGLRSPGTAGADQDVRAQGAGGRETDPVTCLRVVEEIARADAAASWLLMVANSAAFTFSRLPEKTVESLVADQNDWLTAAAIQPPIEAREAPGGFRLTGRRPFASGVSSARSVMLTAMVMDGDQPKLTAAGPQIIIAVMPAAEVEVIDTWYGLGLRGSNSNDVSVKDVFVPSSHTCPMTPAFQANRHYQGAAVSNADRGGRRGLPDRAHRAGRCPHRDRRGASPLVQAGAHGIPRAPARSGGGPGPAGTRRGHAAIGPQSDVRRDDGDLGTHAGRPGPPRWSRRPTSCWQGRTPHRPAPKWWT